MPSVSSCLMATAFRSVQAVHGETVTVLSGADAGKTFTAVILTQATVDIDGEMGTDMREKIVAHFAKDSCPALSQTDVFRDDSGQIWKAVKRVENPADSTTDFELVKIVSGKDQ